MFFKLLLGLSAATSASAVAREKRVYEFHEAATELSRSCHTPVMSSAEIEAADREATRILNQRKKENKVFEKSTVIDVYYHIITCSDGTGSLTDTHLADQITALNDAYSSAGFSFVEADRDVVVNDAWCTGLDIDSTEETAMKNSLRRGDGRALNFYTADLAGGLLGWATFPNWYAGDPAMDGVVNLYSSLPGAGTGAFSLGMTAVHEVGHWLGLYHTFQGGCSGSGDYVDDTPAVAEPNFGCPGTVDSCPTLAGNDMTENFMDYTDDACMNTFTSGQNSRMLDFWNSYRVDTACYVNCGPQPTPSPTVSPQPTTEAELCHDITISMTDSYGDGWNGNYLYFDSVANVDTTPYKVTLSSGSSGSATLCLPSGTYSPFACGGDWVGEVGWTIEGYGISGGASTTCAATSGSFTTTVTGQTVAPTHSPTVAECNVHVTMADSYGDGWNGNYLYFDNDIASTTLKVTLASGSSGSTFICLDPGTYSPFACGGSWDGEVSWTIDDYGISGGADNSCAPSSGSFTVIGDGVTMSPTQSPTAFPTVQPTSAPTACNVVVQMDDSYGDGWNGNFLYFDSDVASTTLKMTLPNGHHMTNTICLDPGTYSPFACGGSWDGEVSWSIVDYGISGGADNTCAPSSGSFTVLAEGATFAPTRSPTVVPTLVPTVAPTVASTTAATGASTGNNECCCSAKLDEVLSNQATMIDSMTLAAASDGKAASSEDESASSSSPGQITLDSTSVVVGTVFCATLFSSVVVVALFYRKKVKDLERALGRHSALSTLEMNAY